MSEAVIRQRVLGGAFWLAIPIGIAFGTFALSSKRFGVKLHPVFLPEAVRLAALSQSKGPGWTNLHRNYI